MPLKFTDITAADAAKECQIRLPRAISDLYAFNDAERFPAAQLADGLERASTLFYADFKVAIPYGFSAVKETWENCRHRDRDYKEITELAVVMNHLGWEYYDDYGDGKPRNPVRDCLSEYFFDRYNELCHFVDCADWPKEHKNHFFAVLD